MKKIIKKISIKYTFFMLSLYADIQMLKIKLITKYRAFKDEK